MRRSGVEPGVFKGPADTLDLGALPSLIDTPAFQPHPVAQAGPAGGGAAGGGVQPLQPLQQQQPQQQPHMGGVGASSQHMGGPSRPLEGLEALSLPDAMEMSLPGGASLAFLPTNLPGAA